MDKNGTPKVKAKRNVFTPAEDARLHFLVRKYGFAWSKISEEMENRSIRQCRERYLNYLAPSIQSGPWTPEEDRLLIEKQKELGHKWTAIAKFFGNRSGANIKNRWSQMISNGQVKDDKPISPDLNPQQNMNSSPPEIQIQTDNQIDKTSDNNTQQQILPTTHLITTSIPSPTKNPTVDSIISSSTNNKSNNNNNNSTTTSNANPPIQLPPIKELSSTTNTEKTNTSLPLSWNMTLADPLIVEDFNQGRKGQNDVGKFRNFKGFAGLIW